MHLKNDFGLKGIYFHSREPSKKVGHWKCMYKEEIVNDELVFFRWSFQTFPPNWYLYFSLLTETVSSRSSFDLNNLNFIIGLVMVLCLRINYSQSGLSYVINIWSLKNHTSELCWWIDNCYSNSKRQHTYVFPQ